MKKMNNKILESAHQKGLTLIEIMVAMSIGLFMIAGVIHVFSSTKESYRTQEAVARIEVNSRFSLEIMTGNIRMAGYKKDPWADSKNVFGTVTTLFPTVGQIVSGSEGGSSDSDQINIRYHGSVNSLGVADGRVYDCEGTSVGDTNIELEFSISGTDLICTIDGATTPVVLADKVSNMQILYGEDTTGDEAVNQYVKASSVSNWQAIVSVKIGLVLGSDENIVNVPQIFPSLSENPMNAVFDHNSDGEPDLFKAGNSSSFTSKTAPDKHLYKIYNSTVSLRNNVL